MVTLPEGAYLIVFVRFVRMEIENEQQITLLVGDDLVLLMRQSNILVQLHHGTELDLLLIHDSVELAQLTVTQQIVIHEVPLTSAVVKAEAVAFAREVDPLRVTELVSHEVQVGLSAQALRYQSNHLVKGHTAGDSQRYRCQLAHACVDLCVE